MYKKIDLHIHTPESSCYVDHVMPEANIETSLEEIVDAAIAAGLDAMAITDHNSAESVEKVRQIAGEKGLYIFPGVEISARGGHALAIFDGDTPVEILYHLIEILGFADEERGQGFCETELWLDEVFWRIEESGGIAIAAHADRRPKGFLASDEPVRVKRRIHSSNHLSALEITVPSTRDLWREGLMPHFPKKYACIQGSDAHSPNEIGRRPIYIECSTIDLAYLRLALREHETRIKFPQDLAEGGNIKV
ncbi:MAG: PHP domain-containing protein [Dehalococcoidia bacterium]|jgi:PHP family Zn ribbon phosphoesterase|nr:PHP domain-containing protein [Dehalococcoidia bacterium]